MKISDIIDTKSIIAVSKSNSKRQLLQELAAKASETSSIDERTIFDALLERENLGTTGFGNSTALPHARIAAAKKVFGVFAKLNSSIDFESVDGKPVDLVFMLISPEDSGADHLTALAQASRVLKDEGVCKKLRHANNPDEIFSILIQ